MTKGLKFLGKVLTILIPIGLILWGLEVDSKLMIAGLEILGILASIIALAWYISWSWGK